MTMLKTNIFGMPYFPGAVIGKLHRGLSGDIANCIVMVTQEEATFLNTRPHGLIIVEAAPFSHKAITLLGMGVPTVLISAQQAAMLKESGEYYINGMTGQITDNLSETPETVTNATERKSTYKKAQTVSMTDGEQVNLLASVSHASAVKQAVDLNAKAIGLVRSEFLLPEDDRIPDVTFYQHAFREICEAAAPLSVTFRLLDVAADKMPAWMPDSETLSQPFGVHGVRLYNADPVAKVFDAQLMALEKLSTDFEFRLLLPFVVRLEEYGYWQDLIRKYLPDHIPVGTMAETPASVLDIKAFIQSADFVAIGCNDLMQNLYAADRDQAELRHYLDPYAPLLYRLFWQIAEQAEDRTRQIQLCGVLPQIQGVLPILLGLGYRTFSVDAPFIPYLENIVSHTSRAECAVLAEKVCESRTTLDVLEIMELPGDGHLPFLN